MKGPLLVSFLLLLLLTLSDASSAGMDAAEAPVWKHVCMKSFNISVCNKLECVKVCVDHDVGWENGECLDKHNCCCHFQ